MAKQVLVIGGSYFAGRVFSILATQSGDYQLHVVNRGRFPLKLEHVTQYQCDRHDTEKLRHLLPADIVFDTVVDFCAYMPGDVSGIVEILPERIRQYILISTCSVYRPMAGQCREDDPVITGSDGSENGDYVFAKVQLEAELQRLCGAGKTACTILRPAFIYGPYNYAPRESVLVQLIVKGIPLPVPADATSRFQMVYVYDVAKALLCSIGDTRTYGEIYNLAAPEQIGYEQLMDVLEHCHGTDLERLCLPEQQLREMGAPLPFPTSGDELYNGEKFAETMDFSYTPFSEGMKHTYDAFMRVYGDP